MRSSLSFFLQLPAPQRASAPNRPVPLCEGDPSHRRVTYEYARKPRPWCRNWLHCNGVGPRKRGASGDLDVVGDGAAERTGSAGSPRRLSARIAAAIGLENATALQEECYGAYLDLFRQTDWLSTRCGRKGDGCRSQDYHHLEQGGLEGLLKAVKRWPGSPSIPTGACEFHWSGRWASATMRSNWLRWRRAGETQPWLQL